MSKEVIPGGGGLPAVASPGAVAAAPLHNLDTAVGAGSPALAVANPSNAEIIVDFRKAMVADGMAEPEVAKVLKWYDGFETRINAAEAHLDKLDHANCHRDLQKAWGSNYKANVAAVHAFFKTLPHVLQDGLETGTTDGCLVLNTPGAWKALLKLSQGGLVTSLTANTVAVADELAEIQRVMREESARYYADTAMQARYRELLDAQQRGQTRIAAPNSDGAELAELRRLMADQNSKYWTGPEAAKLQARYRELLNKGG